MVTVPWKLCSLMLCQRWPFLAVIIFFPKNCDIFCFGTLIPLELRERTNIARSIRYEDFPIVRRVSIACLLQ